MIAVVRAAVATVPRFGVTFTSTAWFGTDLLWLAPEPDDGLRALTAAVWHRFPDPHLPLSVARHTCKIDSWLAVTAHVVGVGVRFGRTQ